LAPRPTHAFTGMQSGRTTLAFATIARHRNAGAPRTGTRSVRRKQEDSVDNRPFPLRIAGKTSKESAESLDVVVHSTVQPPAGKRQTGGESPANGQFAAVLLRRNRVPKRSKAKSPGPTARGFRSQCRLA